MVSVASGTSDQGVWDVPLHGGSNDTVGYHVRPRHPDLEDCWRPQDPLIRVCEMSIDTPFAW